MKLASALLSLLVSVVALPSPPVTNLVEITQEDGPGRELQDTGCTPSVAVTITGGDCFGIGQTIDVTVTTCPTSVPEWVGVFADGTSDFSASSNWLFCCGDQTCASPVPAGTYSLSFGFDSAGSTAWPLADSFGGGGPTYKIFFFTALGIASTISIQITPGYFCEGPYAGVPVALIPPDFIPCPIVGFVEPCFSGSSSDSNSTDSDSDDGSGSGSEEPCVKITPGQGGLQPGKGGIPPGLQCKDKLPPGIAKKQQGNN